MIHSSYLNDKVIIFHHLILEVVSFFLMNAQDSLSCSNPLWQKTISLRASDHLFNDLDCVISNWKPENKQK